jgi:hypothetical protein
MFKIKKTVAVLLLVLFAVSMTAAAVSAGDNGDEHGWKSDSHYWDGNHDWRGHWYNGDFWHIHGHYHGNYWDGDNEWHRWGDHHGDEGRYCQ